MATPVFRRTRWPHDTQLIYYTIRKVICQPKIINNKQKPLLCNDELLHRQAFGGNDTGGRSVVAVGLVFFLEFEVVFVGAGEVVFGVGF